jgi:hypothetical protein
MFKTFVYLLSGHASYLHVVILKLCDSEPVPVQVRSRLYFVWSMYTNICRCLLILMSKNMRGMSSIKFSNLDTH